MMKYVQLLSLLVVFSAAGCGHKKEVKPERKDIVDAVFGSGHLENKNQYVVMANTDGYLKDIYITEDDSVKNNQSLFRIDNEVQETQAENALTKLKFAKNNTGQRAPQIEQVKIQIAQAMDKARIDSLNYKRYERLLKTNAVSQTDYEKAQLQYQESSSSYQVLRKSLADLKLNLNLGLENAKADYKIEKQHNNFYNITSKVSGVVLSVAKKAGDYVKKGDELARLGAGHPIIKLYLAEDDIEAVKAGQTALISLNSRKDKVFKAVIVKKYPSFDLEQQAFVVEASFKEETPGLINGTQLQGNIIIQEKSKALVIPTLYLMAGDAVRIKDRKEQTPVKVGIRTLEWTEIISGITENDVLILPKQN